MAEDMETKFYALHQMRSVPILSPVGQAQFYLSGILPWQDAPNEQLLLCRYANTIDESSGQHELRQLKRLTRHFSERRFEKGHGYVDPLTAREVEKEIIQRESLDCAAGYDLTPAMRLLAEQERNGPVFTQPERNLLLRMLYNCGDPDWIRETAESFREKQCSRRKLIDICRALEQAELSWAGLDTMDGMQYLPTRAPGSPVDLRGCEDPMKHYPPFALYPVLNLPENSVVLQNGTLLREAQDGWWRSGIRRVDQTFAVPHYYKLNDLQFFEVADEEHDVLFRQQPTRQDHGIINEMSF